MIEQYVIFRLHLISLAFQWATAIGRFYCFPSIVISSIVVDSIDYDDFALKIVNHIDRYSVVGFPRPTVKFSVFLPCSINILLL
jgi:hypothetical protein